MTMTVAAAVERLFDNTAIRLHAYDGSVTGPPDGLLVQLVSERGLNYLLTGPGSLGLVRAYLMGDLVFEGITEGDPHDVLRLLDDGFHGRLPSMSDAPALARFVAAHRPWMPELPPEETPGRVRRLAYGLAHGRRRDAEAISHHYDVSNRFYEMLLGPSMAYTCAAYPRAESPLDEAQEHKFDLVCRKLGLAPGMRLLDVGCGWGGMVRHAVTHYGVTALGVTLSSQQARYAADRLAADGLRGRAEIRHVDYRDVREGGFDAVSSIGLTEHIGPRNYPSYFQFLHAKLAPGGRLLNHCITRPDNEHAGLPERGFINRYVFPDGGLTGSGDLVRAAENAGFEVRHHENLREHYALTLRDWCSNLSKHWDEAVMEAGLGVARVWGLYLAGSRLSFERNRIQLHQVLMARTTDDGVSGFGLPVLWPSGDEGVRQR
ncbi:MAG TPA: class I SAM-dependent methyltransferase [Candidatus Lustribacter sp.]|nr:class I SAM-dependent methyltransferase [Candidatus Lustribacter sp.]